MAAQDSTPILRHSDFDFLPDLLDLFERVCDGSLQPKDLHNEAGRLRIRISRARSLLGQVVAGDDQVGVNEQRATIEELKDKIAKKRFLLSKAAELGKAVLEREGGLEENELAFEEQPQEQPVKVKEEIEDEPPKIEVPEVKLIPQPVQSPPKQKQQVKSTDEQSAIQAVPEQLLPPQDQQGEQASEDILQFDNNNNDEMPDWGEDFDMTGEDLQKTIESLPGEQVFGEETGDVGEDSDMQEFMQMMQEGAMEGQGGEFVENQADDGGDEQDGDVMFMMMNEMPPSGADTTQQDPGEENMGGPEQEVQIDELTKAMVEDDVDVMAQFMPMDLS
ncbi:hypothetical protein V1517DRAFT_336209 [Lipomyces orientalis]|uniref:Uncharacterized protein n=1 Tax=Lipomyces orientalis TaxID=1233043 RepID=A0ACC3TVL1_9ASCO